MLAQLSDVNPVTLKEILIVALVAIAALAGFKAAFFPGRREVSPQPLRVTGEPKLVTQSEVELINRAIVERVTRLEVMVESLRTEARNDRDEVRKAILEVERRLTTEISGYNKGTNERINDLLTFLAERLPDPPSK